MITGNKGEWSELYVLLRLLATGKLYAADEKKEKIENVFFPVMRVFRQENNNRKLDFVIINDSKVEVHVNHSYKKEIDRHQLDNFADYLLKQITDGKNRAFTIPYSDLIMKKVECERIKAASDCKADIHMQLHDIYTGYNPVCGFSIKSELGNAPTLLNAGKTTNFVYEVSGLTFESMRRINSIDTSKKIIDRINAIKECGHIEFIKVKNNVFSMNLMLIDSRMEEILGHALLLYYTSGEADCMKIVEKLELKNPLNFPREGFYRHKFKKLLCSIALGMTPATEWNGYDEATGGYIIVKESGDVLAYHLYNRDSFEEYLLRNTRFEKASTSRHDFASIYQEQGHSYINLNLQIRFKEEASK